MDSGLALKLRRLQNRHLAIASLGTCSQVHSVSWPTLVGGRSKVTV